MSHKSKETLSTQVYNTLQGKAGFGRSKHEDKMSGCADGYIYSFSTMKAYIKHCNYFVDWCRDNKDIRNEIGHRPRTLEECKPYIKRFLSYQRDRGLSAYTLNLERSALSKLYGEKIEADTKPVRRSDIKRSRAAAVRDKHFSEKNNADFVNFCRCTGVRRSEYERCSYNDILKLKNGSWAVRITGKGGRERLAPFMGSDKEVSDAILFLRCKEGFRKAHSAADIHSYRADYATKVYLSHCQPLEALKGKYINYTELTGKRDKYGREIWKSALYVCRGDKAGTVYDRAAMIRASQALGHNRESVVGEHYLKV